MDKEIEGATGPVSDETQSVLDELRKEGYELEGEAPAEEPAETPDVPSQEETVEPKQDEFEQPVDRAPKEPALIPAWEHKVAEKKWAKEREALEAELQQLRANPTQANREAVAQTAGNLRELAQQYGLELDDAQERFFSDLLNRAVPQDLTKKLEALEKDRQIAFLEHQYEQEFSKEVTPLIKERYGEVSDAKLAELRAKLHDMAFTETYAKVPLRKVFLAEESDFKLQRNDPSSPVVPGKSGKTRTVQVDYDKVDEDAFKRMSPDEVEKYIDWQVQQSGGKKWR